MAQRISFVLFSDSGTPLINQTPSVLLFRGADGSDIPHPDMNELGDGFYEFSVDLEEYGRVAYMIDCGPNSASKYLVGSVGELVAFAMYDAEGEPDDSLVPTFLSYTDGASGLPAPTLVNLTGGLWGFWPTVSPGASVYYVVGDTNNKSWGTLGATGLLNADPEGDSEISNTQVITFEVLDTESELGRVLIAVEYPEWSATELAWDGQVVCGPFTITTVPIAGGRRYSVVRAGGWPSAPVVRVFLTNQAGKEI